MMKIRQGFVSNSSSSSFILKVDKTEDGMIKIDPKNFGTAIVTEEDLRLEFADRVCCKDKSWEEIKKELINEEMLEEYNEKLAILKSGKIIIMGCVDNNSQEDMEGFFDGLDVEWDY